MFKYIRLFVSLLYRSSYKIHHRLFLRPQAPLRHAKVIIIGSYRTGGAGKTPFTIWLANRILKTGKRVAVLCHKAAWDECIMLEQKIPEGVVFATDNRYAYARKIDEKFDYVICDDGFEDSRFSNAIKICLDWGTSPQSLQDLWPSGVNRSLKQDHPDIDLHLNCDIPSPDITFSIVKIENSKHQSPPPNATIVCGLGNPVRFVQDVKKAENKTYSAIFRKDHDHHFANFIEREIQRGNKIIVSEKDSYRLSDKTRRHSHLFISYQSITVKFDVLGTIDLVCQQR